jgi:hypothetical protein
MSLAIACWVRDTAIISAKRGEELQKAMLNSMVYTNTILNTNIRGQRGFKKHQSAFEKPSNNTVEKHKENLDKFGWIFKG